MAGKTDIVDIKKYRGKRRISEWLRRSLLLVFLVACLFAGYFFSRSPFFTVRSIEIIGNTNADYESLCRISGYELGKSIFNVSKGAAADYLHISPWVDSAKVRLKLPGTVIIEIKEREPVALISVDSAVITIDITGRVLSRSVKVENPSLPFITGIDMTGCGAVAGSIVDAEGISDAMAVLSDLPDDAENIGEINVSNSQDIRLYLSDDTEIRLGDSSNMKEKHLVYANILKDIRSNSAQIVHYIDVSIVEWPVFK